VTARPDPGGTVGGMSGSEAQLLAYYGQLLHVPRPLPPALLDRILSHRFPRRLDRHHQARLLLGRAELAAAAAEQVFSSAGSEADQPFELAELTAAWLLRSERYTLEEALDAADADTWTAEALISRCGSAHSALLSELCRDRRLDIAGAAAGAEHCPDTDALDTIDRLDAEVLRRVGDPLMGWLTAHHHHAGWEPYVGLRVALSGPSARRHAAHLTRSVRMRGALHTLFDHGPVTMTAADAPSVLDAFLLPMLSHHRNDPEGLRELLPCTAAVLTAGLSADDVGRVTTAWRARLRMLPAELAAELTELLPGVAGGVLDQPARGLLSLDSAALVEVIAAAEHLPGAGTAAFWQLTEQLTENSTSTIAEILLTVDAVLTPGGSRPAQHP
jgi:hypothetical protein